MNRKIVLLSDGTGNSAAKVWRTNVWRVFESLDLSSSEQVAFYDDGVGTAAFKPLAIIGGAFGLGLGRNIVDIYKFACRNYRDDDDEIYGFGFSRGAFTIRVVTGLILDQGLVKAQSEPELHAKAKAAYRAFRAKNFHTRWPRWCRPEEWARRLRDFFTRSNYSDADNRKLIKIRFLGLWDTVAAYGMPVEEMTRGISQWLWPWMLPDCVLHPSVQRACHALSIDDDRTTFHPVLWDETQEKPLKPDGHGRRYLKDERISQVWFAGVHSNVGGGYPDDSLAQIPLIWIMSEAKICGLQFKSASDANPQTIGHPMTAQDRDGRIYDPRKGLGGYYRYGPRDIDALGKGLLSRQGAAPVPRIHESVFLRIRNRAHAYAPLGLPAEYEIVDINGEVFSSAEKGYETIAQALARCHGQQRLWNMVWWRRGVYFVTVIVSLFLFSFPLIKAAPSAYEYETPLRWVSTIVRTAGAFLPSAATPWLNGYAREPGKFVAVVVLLSMMLLWSSWFAAKIQAKMDRLWRDSFASRLVDKGPATDVVHRLRTDPRYLCVHAALTKTITPALYAALFIYLGVTFTSHALFNVFEDAGFVCKETSGQPEDLGPGDFLAVKSNGQATTLKLDYYAQRAKSDPSVQVANKSNPFKYLAQYNVALPVLRTDQLCQGTGVKLEQYGRYNLKFDNTDAFTDWNGAISAPYGYYSFGVISNPTRQKNDDRYSAKMSLLEKLGVMALVPLRRELAMPWYRIVARIGGTGGQEKPFGPDFTDQYIFNDNLTAARSGELFLFVNDAVIGIPGLFNLFYNSNEGEVRVLITRR